MCSLIDARASVFLTPWNRKADWFLMIYVNNNNRIIPIPLVTILNQILF